MYKDMDGGLEGGHTKGILWMHALVSCARARILHEEMGKIDLGIARTSSRWIEPFWAISFGVASITWYK